MQKGACVMAVLHDGSVLMQEEMHVHGVWPVPGGSSAL
jgi:hypothetical protein